MHFVLFSLWSDVSWLRPFIGPFHAKTKDFFFSKVLLTCQFAADRIDKNLNNFSINSAIFFWSENNFRFARTSRCASPNKKLKFHLRLNTEKKLLSHRWKTSQKTTKSWKRKHFCRSKYWLAGWKSFLWSSLCNLDPPSRTKRLLIEISPKSKFWFQ